MSWTDVSQHVHLRIPQGSAARRLVSCLMITLGAGMVEGSLLVNWAHGNAGGRGFSDVAGRSMVVPGKTRCEKLRGLDGIMEDGRYMMIYDSSLSLSLYIYIYVVYV